jgi:hypothetical protein
MTVDTASPQQRGLHSLGFTQSQLATEWESPISNMYFELDRYLAL